MAGEYGIQETKEAVTGLMKIAALLGRHLKDGFQAGADLQAIWNEFQSNPELQEQLRLAYENASAIPNELGDISTMEGIQLAMHSAPLVLEVAGALRK